MSESHKKLLNTITFRIAITVTRLMNLRHQNNI